METTERSVLAGKLIPELQQIAQNLGIEGTQKLRKAGLIDAIMERSSDTPASSGDGGATTRTATTTAIETRETGESNGETVVEERPAQRVSDDRGERLDRGP